MVIYVFLMLGSTPSIVGSISQVFPIKRLHDNERRFFEFTLAILKAQEQSVHLVQLAESK